MRTTKLSMAGSALFAMLLGGCPLAPQSQQTTVQPVQVTQPAVEAAQVQVVNGSQTSICYVRFSPAAATSWEGTPDALGNDQIQPGQSHSFPLTSGSWDVMLEACDDGSSPFGHQQLLMQRYEVPAGNGLVINYAPAPAAAAAPAAPAGPPVAVRITNRSRTVICYAHFSPASESTWETAEDALGSNVIGAGSTFEAHTTAGSWDVLLEACGDGDSPLHHPELMRQHFEIPAGAPFQITYPPAAPRAARGAAPRARH